MRRSYLFLLVAFVVVLAVPAQAMATGSHSSSGTVDFTHGVASGDVTQTSAILWTRAVPTSGNPFVKVEVWRESWCGGFFRSFSRLAQPQASRDYTIKIDAKGLWPDTKYCYRFRTSSSNVSVTGHFKTAPSTKRFWGWWWGHHQQAPGKDVHITFDGDQDSAGTFAAPCCGTFNVLGQVAASGADFYVNNGDNIYSDSSHYVSPDTTLAEYRQSYKDALTFPNLLATRQAMSQYGLMDDHEVYNDYDGQTVDPARYANGRRAFLDYHPVRETGLLHDSSCAGDPLYRKVKWGADVEIFVLDERSCRSASVEGPPCNGDLGPTLPPAVRQTPPFNFFLTPNPPPGCVDAINDPSRTVLGPVQKAKFKNDLLASNAKFKYVMNEYAIQQWYALPYDRWEGYGAERSELLNFIRDNGINNVTFLTTDHHATIQNEVVIDHYSDPDPIAYDFVTGPVGTETLKQEVIATVGPIGFGAFQLILSQVGIDCKNLDKFSWGDVQYTASSATTAIASRDENGATIMDDTIPLNQCARTLGP